jgi:hypothetical protein
MTKNWKILNNKNQELKHMTQKMMRMAIVLEDKKDLQRRIVDHIQ